MGDPERPHRRLRLESPVTRARAVGGEVQSRPVLRGLRYVSERAP